jgi:sialate O-acetylesterase
MRRNHQLSRLSILFVVLTIAFVSPAFAVIRLPNIIASNMVLQQKSDAVLWGWANPGEKIYVTTSWNMKMDSVTGDRDARWKIKVATPQAGGPYTITLKGSNIITLDNILIGEVWICSGQSNMEWSSNHKLQQMIDEMPNSANEKLRLFHVPKSTSKFPQDNIEGNWKSSESASLEGFSAIGYFFARELQQKLNVPVGIINSSWGGTPAEVWTPEGLVTKDPELLAAAGKQIVTAAWPVDPGYAYNSMIHPITNFPIAGAIWYQGESNVLMAATYNKLFSAMINSWREAWQKQFPFYFVEIAPFAYPNPNVAALLREAQTKTLTLPNTGMVVITDLVDNIKDIHPKNKKDVGLRLANYALAETYGQKVQAYKSPYFSRMEVVGSNANLYFDNAPTGFKTSDGQSPNEFYVAGADQVFVPARVKIENDRLVVSSDQVKTPVAVRFAFTNEAMPNVFSKEGLPVAPFRTDNWEVKSGSARNTN